MPRGRTLLAALAASLISLVPAGCGPGGLPAGGQPATSNPVPSASAAPLRSGGGPTPSAAVEASVAPGPTVAPSSPAAEPSSEPTRAPAPDSLRIAFVATGWCVGGGAVEVMGIDPDGSRQTNLSCAKSSDLDPAWSPDGRRIAFASKRDGNFEIYVMNADGTGQTRLTDEPTTDIHPTWSPDGSRIAFASGRSTPKNTTDLWVMNADGSNPVRLLEMSGREVYPDWSPDGKQIAFSHFGGGTAGIHVIDSDGTGLRVLAAGPNHSPQWSPDGKSIAFDGEPNDCTFEIYVAKSAGGKFRRVTSHPDGCGGYNKHPSWSPDGRTLVFSSTRRTAERNEVRLYTVPAAGGQPVLLLPYRSEREYSGPHDPDWSWAP